MKIDGKKSIWRASLTRGRANPPVPWGPPSERPSEKPWGAGGPGLRPGGHPPPAPHPSTPSPSPLHPLHPPAPPHRGSRPPAREYPSCPVLAASAPRWRHCAGLAPWASVARSRLNILHPRPAPREACRAFPGALPFQLVSILKPGDN